MAFLTLASFLAAWSPLHHALHLDVEADCESACHATSDSERSHDPPAGEHDSSHCFVCYLTRSGLALTGIELPTLIELRPATPNVVIAVSRSAYSTAKAAHRTRGPPPPLPLA